MTSNLRPDQTPPPVLIPSQVHVDWRQAHIHEQSAAQAAAQLPVVEAEIAAAVDRVEALRNAEAQLETLKARYTELRRQYTEHSDNGQAAREMVTLWCREHGVDLASLGAGETPLQGSVPLPRSAEYGMCRHCRTSVFRSQGGEWLHLAGRTRMCGPESATCAEPADGDHDDRYPPSGAITSREQLLTAPVPQAEPDPSGPHPSVPDGRPVEETRPGRTAQARAAQVWATALWVVWVLVLMPVMVTVSWVGGVFRRRHHGTHRHLGKAVAA